MPVALHTVIGLRAKSNKQLVSVCGVRFGHGVQRVVERCAYAAVGRGMGCQTLKGIFQINGINPVLL